PIRPEPATCRAWQAREATLPVSPPSRRTLSGNGWPCSRSLRGDLNGSHCSSIRRPPPSRKRSGAPSKPPRLRLQSSRFAWTCATRSKSNAPLTPSREPNGGMLAVPETTVTLHRELVIGLVTRLRLPMLYPYRYFPNSGGLASYGIDVREMWRQAASYVDRIFNGEKPADLPVQAPTKFELVINLRTAKALGLEVPPTLLARADEV